jgi:hypothetical protein
MRRLIGNDLDQPGLLGRERLVQGLAEIAGR